MNNRRIPKWMIALLSIFIFIIMFFFFVHDKKEFINNEVDFVKGKIDNDKIIEQKIVEQSKTERVMLKKLPEKFIKAIEIAKSANFTINFYGKVVDQNNKPLEGAKIKYSTIGLWNLANSNRGVVTTDKSGVFNVRTEGNKMFLEMPEHPNIATAYVSSVNALSSGEPRKTIQFKAGNETYNNSEGWGGYSINSPYLINVWRVKKFENVSHKSTLIGLKPNNESHTFIRNRTGLMVAKLGNDSKGDLIMTCIRDNEGLNKKNGEWKVVIEAVDGGIQEVTDHYLYEAPTDGYQSSIIISKEANEEYGSSVLRNKKYYYTAHGGRVYGSLVIDFEPYMKKRYCGLFIDYKINSNNSRNLAISE